MKKQSRNRGTILILVVAVLALLVVMGTAFLTTSRNDSSAARVMNDSVNMDLSTQGVIAEVQSAIFESQLNPQDGSVLGGMWVVGKAYNVGDSVFSPIDGYAYKVKSSKAHTSDNDTHGPPPTNTTDWEKATAASNLARFFDYPDRFTSDGHTYSSDNLGFPKLSWLATTAVPTANTGSDVSNTRNGLFQPTTGNYVTGALYTSANVSAMGGTNMYKDAVWNMLPFSSSGGVRYRYAIRVIDTNRFANINTGQVQTVSDGSATEPLATEQGQTLISTWLACPTIFSSSDTSFLLNYNDNDTADTKGVRGRVQTIRDAGGAFPTTLLNWQNIVLGYERMGINPAAGNTSTIKAEWYGLDDELEMRAYGVNGNNYMARPATNNSPKIWPNTLGAGNTTRQNYTTYSFDRKFAAINTQALVTSLPFSISVTNYSSNKWAGESTTSTLQNLYARPVNLAQPTADSDDNVARQAVRIANAMYASGFTQDEIFSYVINYVAQTKTSRGSSSIDVTSATAATLYMSSGTANSNTYTITCTGSSMTSGIQYYAYRAQPFINEVAIAKKDTDNATDVTSPATTTGDTDLTTNPSNKPYVQDFAVELMNPYGSANDPLDKTTLDIGTWRIRVVCGGTTYWAMINSGTPAVTSITNAANTTNKGLLVIHMKQDTTKQTPVNNNLTITGDKTDLDFTTTGDSTGVNMNTVPLTSDITSVSVYLERPDNNGVATGGSTAKWVVVDSMVVSSIPAATTTAKQYSQQRANFIAVSTPPAPAVLTPSGVGSTTVVDPWLCMSNVYISEVSSTLPSLGSYNPAANKLASDNTKTLQFYSDGVAGKRNLYGVYLRDRRQSTDSNVDATVPTLIEQGGANTPAIGGHHIGDLMNFSRVAIRYSGSTFTTIPDVISNAAQKPVPLTNSQFPQEGRFYFDFSADPRAAALLENVVTVDRASDGYDQTGNGVDDMTELRTPGRINVNTASFDVLCAMIQGANPNMTVIDVANHAAVIIAYRDRTTVASGTGIGSYKTNAATPTFSSTDFPGKGIRTIGELAIPLGIADGTISYKSGNTPPFEVLTQPSSSAYFPSANYSIMDVFGRGALTTSYGSTWAKIFNTATVRSDTFIVYGYVEAVKKNPNYTGTFDPDDSWYQGDSNGQGWRNPSASNPLQLMSSRRFIAVVDRSYSNNPRGASAVLPKIVAYKELPR